MATDSPIFTSLARYCSTECTGTPAIFTGAPAELPRWVSVRSMSLRRFLGVVVEQLVEIPHPVEHQDVGVLALDAQVLLHHRGVLKGVDFQLPFLSGR